MTLVPSNLPPPGDGDDVQRVRVVRAGDDAGRGSAPVSDAGPAWTDSAHSASVAVTGSLFGPKAVAVLGTGKRTFFATVKWTSLFGALLAFLAAWYATNGSALRDAVTFLLVLGPSVGVAVALAVQRAAAALAVETWRQSGLVGRVLDTLLDRVARSPVGDGSDAATPAVGPADLPVTRLPLSDATARLSRASEGWAGGTDGPSSLSGASAVGGLVGRAQRWVAGLVEQVAQREFRRSSKDGQVDLNEVRLGLDGRLDDLVAARVRAGSWSAVGGAVLALLTWALLVAWAVKRLWA
jgi:hypothetical protein